MEPQKTQNCQNNSEEKEKSWRHNPPRLQTILQNYSNQKSVVLAHTHTHTQNTGILQSNENDLQLHVACEYISQM